MRVPGTPMDDSRKDLLKQALATWLHERLRTLQEQILLTWEEGMGRMSPDESLLERLAAAWVPEEKIPPPPSPQDTFPEVAADTDSDLGDALDLIESAASQGEVLKRLLEGLQAFVERSALFVVKQGIASLYVQRGFESDHPRLGASVVPPPELEELLEGRVRILERPGQAYLALLGSLSRFEATDLRILPLRLRRKCVALLLVDSGLRQVLDHPGHVRALAHAAEACLSHMAGLKDEDRTVTSPAASISHSSTPTVRIPDPIPEVQVPPLDPKIKANAERSARVLAADIELYFPAKVAQGKRQGNVYALLKDELDRSHASFSDRYGPEVEDRHHIFFQTVVQLLCDGNPSLMSGAPWAPKA